VRCIVTISRLGFGDSFFIIPRNYFMRSTSPRTLVHSPTSFLSLTSVSPPSPPPIILDQISSCYLPQPPSRKYPCLRWLSVGAILGPVHCTRSISPPSITWILRGNSSSLRTAKNVLCMHIIRFTQFFQLSKKNKNLTFLVFSECVLTSDFQKCTALCEVSEPYPRILVRTTYWPQIGNSVKTLNYSAPSGHDVLR
jgi:hypothetical protein